MFCFKASDVDSKSTLTNIALQITVSAKKTSLRGINKENYSLCVSNDFGSNGKLTLCTMGLVVNILTEGTVLSRG